MMHNSSMAAEADAFFTDMHAIQRRQHRFLAGRNHAKMSGLGFHSGSRPSVWQRCSYVWPSMESENVTRLVHDWFAVHLSR
ncbi:hypothetical protein BUPH_08230 (plasmid) [Paraburkholderia phenoliruptrix BR3459a]|uniref:Uncharacterized protein n=1 Tax=Paraburkholderia phenoliruptrix BR3459a TaxID=1229205 RepID=K0DUU9_9BURK|nr:hypothetical protein BUPH_08230 [Paraburkholderia phenoliruptrix BR3459a]